MTTAETKKATWIRWFEELDSDLVEEVGGKNASLGEMFSRLQERGLRVPGGFATTAEAYRAFLRHNELEDSIRELLEREEPSKAGSRIRELILEAELPPELSGAIGDAYLELSRRAGMEEEEFDVAARSSATAEDLPEASFAGQQETYLNLRGKEQVLEGCLRCYASLFTDRAISYREENGFDHMKVAISVGVQRMVRADKAGAGVMFTLDTESGFPDLVVINAGWGLGESVVAGSINPDEFRVYKPLLKDESLAPIVGMKLGTKAHKRVYATGGDEPIQKVETSTEEQHSFVLTDQEILKLARWAVLIEDHYGKPMDIEWAKDGPEGELFIVQARPETVRSQEEEGLIQSYSLQERGEVVVEGAAIGSAIASGPVCILDSPDQADEFTEGHLLVTSRTDPDWVPIMRKAAGIITDQGGRTSHAAIVSRELGLPAVVGTGDGTSLLAELEEATVSCAEGEVGVVYAGKLAFEARRIELDDLPQTETEMMINIANPDAAFQWWRLPCDGVGLTRLEFLINNYIKIHPLALLRFDEIEDEDTRERIEELTAAYSDGEEFFRDTLARGIAKVAASRYPKPVIVRTSDFKSNEYADLIGGETFEPQEANPMLGFRGASRYYHSSFREAFKLECQALKKAREELGFDNIIAMIPFCRTPEEADNVLEIMAEAGLVRGRHGFQVYVMIEIPSNVELAEEFALRFDGFSIGSNDLTQLVLGVDRDSDTLSDLFDERHPAVKRVIARLIATAREHKTKVGICGQAPSDYPEFAAFLTEQRIDSISVNPDSLIKAQEEVARAEGRRS
jgi:pyruvate, water dikinase